MRIEFKKSEFLLDDSYKIMRGSSAKPVIKIKLRKGKAKKGEAVAEDVMQTVEVTTVELADVIKYMAERSRSWEESLSLDLEVGRAVDMHDEFELPEFQLETAEGIDLGTFKMDEPEFMNMEFDFPEEPQRRQLSPEAIVMELEEPRVEQEEVVEQPEAEPPAVEQPAQPQRRAKKRVSKFTPPSDADVTLFAQLKFPHCLSFLTHISIAGL